MAQQLADLMNTKKVSGNTTEQYPESRRARSRVKHDLSSMSSTYKSKEEFSTKLEDKTTDKQQKLVSEKQKLNNSKTTDKQQKLVSEKQKLNNSKTTDKQQKLVSEKQQQNNSKTTDKQQKLVSEKQKLNNSKTTDKQQKLVSEKQQQNNSKTTDKQQKNHNHNSFTKNPLPIEFALLGGKGKDIIEYILLKSKNTGDEVPIRSSDIVENMRVSRDHVSDTIVRLYKKGYIRYTAHYGFRVLAVNPSILS
jgi:hypothetical protein